MAGLTCVYVSAADAGRLEVFTLDTATGRLLQRGRVAAGAMVMPLTLSPDRRRLYAAIRSAPFRVASYAIDQSTGTLKALGEAPLPSSMASIATDRTGRYLLAASYGDSCISVSAIDPAGRVAGAPVQVLPAGLHAHAIGTDRTNQTVYAPCLGSDQIFTARFDAATGQLTPVEPCPMAAGDGPRHFRLSPDNRFVYVLNELSGHVTQLARDGASGRLTLSKSVSAVPASACLARGRISVPIAHGQPVPPMPEPRIWAADLHLTPDGRFLYASERTTSTLALFHVDRTTGRLTYRGNWPTATQPRGFAIDPSGSWLIAAGEKADHIAVHRIDPASGDLTDAGRAAVGRGANWVEIVTLP